MLQKYLMIGLGGSGGSALRYTWREVERRLRSVGWDAGMPAVYQFLHIDVRGVPEPGNTETGDALQGAEHYLGLAHFPVTYQEHDAQLVSHAASLSGLVGWRPEPARVDAEVWSGAGQRRAVGRLIAVKQLDQIKTAVESALTLMTTPAAGAQYEELNNLIGDDIDIESPARVIVATSLGGGAGSGILVDVWDLLASMAIGDREWLNQGVSILFTSEIFPKRPKRPGLNPNSFAAMSELISAYQHEGPIDPRERELLTRAGLGGANIAGRRATTFNFLIGGRNDADISFGTSEDAYRAVGTALGSIVTNVQVQAMFDSYLSGNYSETAPATHLSMDPGGAAGGANPASSFGYATVSLGNRLFGRYAQERLARAAVDRLLNAHMDNLPAGPRPPEDQVIRQRASEVCETFYADCGLFELDDVHNDIIEALRARPTDKLATPAYAISEDVSKKFPGDMAASDWFKALQGIIGDVEKRHGTEVDEQHLANARAWVNQIQERLPERTARLLGVEGGPVSIECLSRLDAQLEQAAASLRREITSLNDDEIAKLRDHAGKLIMAIGKKKVARNNPKVRTAIDRAGSFIEKSAEVKVREFAIPLIEDLRTGLLAPLRTSLESAVAALEKEVAGKKSGAAFKSWPIREVPAHLAPAPNDVLLRGPATWDELFGERLLATLGSDADSDEQVGGVRDAEHAAIREVLSGAWVRTGALDATAKQDLIESRGDWGPKLGSLGLGSARPASFRIQIGTANVLARSRTWSLERRGAMADSFRESIADYLALDENDQVDQDRLDKFTNALSSGLRLAHPLVAINDAALGALHPGHELSYLPAMDPLPFGENHPAYNPCRQLLMREGVPVEELPGYFRVGAGPANRVAGPDEIEITNFVSGSLHPLVFSSLTSDLVVDWNQRAGTAIERARFWRMRRSRLLPNFVPVSSGGQLAMTTGWLVARLLNRVDGVERHQLRTQNPDNPSPIRIWSREGWLEFPKYPLGPLPSSVSDVLPSLFESIPVAMLGLAQGDRTAIGAYAELHRLGEPPSQTGLDAALEAWIADGLTPDGAPAPKAGFAGDSAGTALERRSAIIDALRKMQADYEEIATRTMAPDFTLNPERSWEVAPLMLHALGRLIERIESLVDRGPTEPTEDDDDEPLS